MAKRPAKRASKKPLTTGAKKRTKIAKKPVAKKKAKKPKKLSRKSVGTEQQELQKIFRRFPFLDAVEARMFWAVREGLPYGRQVEYLLESNFVPISLKKDLASCALDLRETLLIKYSFDYSTYEDLTGCDFEVKIDFFGLPHCIDGPAATHADGSYVYMQYGLHHRIGGPAIVDTRTGREIYKQCGYLHNTEGPAYKNEQTDSYEYYLQGQKDEKGGLEFLCMIDAPEHRHKCIMPDILDFNVNGCAQPLNYLLWRIEQAFVHAGLDPAEVNERLFGDDWP